MIIPLCSIDLQYFRGLVCTELRAPRNLSPAFNLRQNFKLEKAMKEAFAKGLQQMFHQNHGYNLGNGKSLVVFEIKSRNPRGHLTESYR